MKFEPHGYQMDAIRWVIDHQIAGLFLPPGLGKTSIMLSAMNTLINYQSIEKVLIIAPLRVCQNVWPNEVKKWDDFKHLNVVFLRGKNKKIDLIADADIVVINPEGLPWLYKNIKSIAQYKMALICDESTLFKNNKSERFKLLKKMLPLFKRRYILTGTPAPNGLVQLWSQIYILDKGERLGKYISHFKNNFFNQIGWGWYDSGLELKPYADVAIYRLIGDIVMHKSQDELTLPPVVNNYIEFTLPSLASAQYKSMQQMLVANVDDIEVIAMNAASKCQKLKQIANGTGYDEFKQLVNYHNEKLAAVHELVDTLGARPLLILYELKCDLQKLLNAFPYAKYIGGGSTHDDDTIRDWNAGELQILLLQPSAGGHGLNLQTSGCHDVCWYSIPFDLELYIQANARVHRQGVKNSVTIHHIVAKNTIDEHILGVLAGKSTLQNALLGALKK